MERTSSRCRWAIGVLIGFVVFGSGILYWYKVRPHVKHSEVFRRVDTAIESLSDRCPSDITALQWRHCVGWTNTASHNLCAHRSFIRDYPAFLSFAEKLHERVQNQANLETIDWIWDQFETITHAGRSYSERWRPTTLERMQNPTNWAN